VDDRVTLALISGGGALMRRLERSRQGSMFEHKFDRRVNVAEDLQALLDAVHDFMCLIALKTFTPNGVSDMDRFVTARTRSSLPKSCSGRLICVTSVDRLRPRALAAALSVG
jgi:hypothetical protein